MSYILVNLRVKDYAKWRPFFDGMAANRKANGSRGGHLMRSKDNPNELAILFEWDDVEKGRRFYESAEFQRVAAEAGIIGKPEVHYLEELERVSS